MQPIRVLLAGIEDGLREAIRGEDDMTIVGEVSTPVEILLAVGERAVDVVILPFDGSERPGVSSLLLTQYPDLTVLGVSRKPGRAYVEQLCPAQVEVADARPAALLEAIRHAVRHPCSEPAVLRESASDGVDRKGSGPAHSRD